VARAFVEVRLVGLPELLHFGLGRRDGRVHPRVVAAIEPEDRRLDTRQIRLLGRSPVIDDRRVEIRL
jgi:hypothetical protein